MATKKVECTIKGISPLLMNAFKEPAEGFSKWLPEQQAEYKTYRIPDTENLYVPGIAIQRCFVGSATYSKGKGRASLQKVVAACVMVNPEYCELGTKEYIIDSRPVVNPTTKGRIMCHRPRLNDWSVSFEIDYDDLLLTDVQLRRVVDDAGSRVGLLDFRPERKGSFGRFMVTDWK